MTKLVATPMTKLVTTSRTTPMTLSVTTRTTTPKMTMTMTMPVMQQRAWGVGRMAESTPAGRPLIAGLIDRLLTL